MHLFVRRILDSMEGLAHPEPVWRTGILASPVTRHPLEHRFPWGIAHTDETGRVVIQVNDDQNSLSLNTFATSNSLVAIRSGAGQIAKGQCVDYLSLE
jgi:molybdopterin biosynthesis enzyme